MMRLAILFLLSWSSIVTPISTATALQTLWTAQKDSTNLPKVFMNGDYEDAYAALCAESKLLFEVCNNDVDAAYSKWYSMLLEMESYADAIGFDLRGTKILMNVFWEPDGSFRHIVFQLKPNSRNIDEKELTAFFNSFIKTYKFPLVTSHRYVNYGAASFPVNPQRINNK